MPEVTESPLSGGAKAPPLLLLHGYVGRPANVAIPDR